MAYLFYEQNKSLSLLTSNLGYVDCAG